MTPAVTEPGRDTKLGALIAALRRKKGATIADLMEATGWQAHSVRGAISGALKKKLGLEVTSEKTEGRERVYRIGGQHEMKRLTAEEVEREIDALDTSDLVALRNRWRDLFKIDPPAKDPVGLSQAGNRLPPARTGLWRVEASGHFASSRCTPSRRGRGVERYPAGRRRKMATPAPSASASCSRPAPG